MAQALLADGPARTRALLLMCQAQPPGPSGDGRHAAQGPERHGRQRRAAAAGERGERGERRELLEAVVGRGAPPLGRRQGLKTRRIAMDFHGF